MSWSFRVEIKEHGNPDIRDLFYLDLRRTYLSYSSALLNFLNNANVEFMTEFARDDLQVMRQQFIIGRKCTRRLANSDADELTFVFRPNIKF